MSELRCSLPAWYRTKTRKAVVPMANETASEADDFATFLQEMSHGEVNKLATSKLREIVAACVDTGQKGSITITFSIKAESRLAEVTAKVKTTKPEPKVPGQAYYTGADGALHNEDPRQLKLPAKVLDVSHGAPRIVGKDS